MGMLCIQDTRAQRYADRQFIFPTHPQITEEDPWQGCEKEVEEGAIAFSLSTVIIDVFGQIEGVGLTCKKEANCVNVKVALLAQG